MTDVQSGEIQTIWRQNFSYLFVIDDLHKKEIICSKYQTGQATSLLVVNIFHLIPECISCLFVGTFADNLFWQMAAFQLIQVFHLFQ